MSPSIPEALHKALRVQRVVPVLTLDDVSQAILLVRTLAQSGLPIVEVTMRTHAALDVVRALSLEVPEACVGVGTIRRARDIDAATDAGARFLVAPGHTDELLNASMQAPIPFVPGAATASEVMRAADRGWRLIKFFPAQAIGGAKALAAMAAPLADIEFMPTGGINASNLADYLALSNVLACGGSWMVPAKQLAEGNYPAIAAIAREITGQGAGNSPDRRQNAI